MNISLIGMSGAGKSHFGEQVARKSGLEFLDIDRMVLEPARGKPLQEILDEIGDEAFMRWEEQAIIDATSGRDGLLISTPGSVVYEKVAMEHLRGISKVIYLKAPFRDIERRAQGARGIVGGGTKSLREIHEERSPLYEKYAHHAIDTSALSAPGTVQAILALC